MAFLFEGETAKLNKSEGTYYFMSPESQDKDQATKGIDGFKVDIWAMGVTFWAFCFLEVPFYDETLEQLFIKI